MHVNPGGGRSDEVISISIPDTNLAIDRSLALKVLGVVFLVRLWCHRLGCVSLLFRPTVLCCVGPTGWFLRD